MRLRDAASILAVAGLQLGQLRARDDIVGRHARWHYVIDGEHWSLGWGDLAGDDLLRVRPAVGRGVFLALNGGMDQPAWPLYRHVGRLPDEVVNTTCLAEQVRYVVTAEGGVSGVALRGEIRPAKRALWSGGPVVTDLPLPLLTRLITLA